MGLRLRGVSTGEIFQIGKVEQVKEAGKHLSCPSAAAEEAGAGLINPAAARRFCRLRVGKRRHGKEGRDESGAGCGS